MASEPIHSRVDLACEQLDVAIELFFAKSSYVSALTLAGAADEILGVEAKNRGLKNTLTAKYSVLSQFLRAASKQVPPWQTFKDDENYARNAAKHIADKSQSKPYDPFLQGDLRLAATRMLLRAANNVRLLGLPKSDHVRKLEGWYLSDVTFPGEPDA